MIEDVNDQIYVNVDKQGASIVERESKLVKREFNEDGSIIDIKEL